MAPAPNLDQSTDLWRFQVLLLSAYENLCDTASPLLVQSEPGGETCDFQVPSYGLATWEV